MIDPTRKSATPVLPAPDLSTEANAGSATPMALAIAEPATLLQAPRRHPLGGAFDATALRGRAFGGPMLAGELDEATERRLLRDNDGRGMLAAWNGFDAGRKPVVLVHGINGSGSELLPLAQRLSSAGRQVLIFLYDDRGSETHQSGKQLAGALRQLAAHYAPGAPLDIVGHSMGGIVSRAALNYLEDPGWMGETVAGSSEPRAGFGAMRLRTVDTPWDGFQHEPERGALAWLFAPLVWLGGFVMRLFGVGGLWQMRGTSDMFKRLYEPRLAGVDARNYAAQNRDAIRSLPELDDGEAHAMARFLVSNVVPETPRLRNLAKALQDDARFYDLCTRARAALRSGRISLEAPSPALTREITRLHDSVMPRFEGSHTGVLADQPHDRDLVDELVRELG